MTDHARRSVLVRPRGRLGLVLALLAITLGGLFSTGSPASADITYSQNVKAVGEVKYVTGFRNYANKVNATSCNKGGCIVVDSYWRVATGTETVRLTTFKVTESIKAYDYYLLDYDTTVSNHGGTSRSGSNAMTVSTYNATVYDTNDSKSVSAQKSSCATVGISMSTPWPVVGASTTVGHFTACDDTSKVTRTSTGHYTASIISKVNHMTIQRWVKVKSGAKPRFKVSFTHPTDACTHHDSHGHCTSFSNTSASRTMYVGTSG